MVTIPTYQVQADEATQMWHVKISHPLMLPQTFLLPFRVVKSMAGAMLLREAGLEAAAAAPTPPDNNNRR